MSTADDTDATDAEELEELPDDTDDSPNVEVIEDPDSYIQSRRLRDIFDARKQVRKQRLRAKTHYIDNNDSPRGIRGAKRAYRAAVENYLAELRPLFLSDEQGKQVWFNLDFGTLQIEMPTERETVGREQSRVVYKEVKADGSIRKHPMSNQPDPKIINLQGLNYLFELPEPIVAEFEFISTSSGRWGGGTNRHHVTTQHDIGFDRLDAVVNEANHRLQQRGLDLDLSEDDSVAESDYSDIL